MVTLTGTQSYMICATDYIVFRSVKWWKRVFFHLFDLSIVNANILLYNSVARKPMTQLDFRLALILALLEGTSSQSGKAYLWHQSRPSHAPNNWKTFHKEDWSWHKVWRSATMCCLQGKGKTLSNAIWEILIIIDGEGIVPEPSSGQLYDGNLSPSSLCRPIIVYH